MQAHRPGGASGPPPRSPHRPAILLL